jgi:glutathione S-transferase
MYILHQNPFSFYSRRVIALLEEAGIAYESRAINLMIGQHKSEAFIQLNPNGQVPVLEDGDLVLAESNAILRYLSDREGLADWYPTDAQVRARIDQWLDWNQCRLSPATGNIVFNSVFMGENGDAAAIARGRDSLATLAPILEQALQMRPYIAGERASIADLSIASSLSQLELAQARPTSPAITRWYEAMGTLKGVQCAEAAMAEAMKAMKGAAMAD